MKITKIVVGRGTSRETAENEWDKPHYELHATLDGTETQEQLDFIKDELDAKIDRWLFYGDKAKTPPKREEAIPLRIVGVDRIKWVASRWVRESDSDRTARQGEDAWVHRRDNNAGELIALINAQGKVSDTSYEYTFSGEGDMFISRKALRKKE